MICSKCGAEVSGERCSACGTAVQNDQSTHTGGGG